MAFPFSSAIRRLPSGSAHAPPFEVGRERYHHSPLEIDDARRSRTHREQPLRLHIRLAHQRTQLIGQDPEERGGPLVMRCLDDTASHQLTPKIGNPEAAPSGAEIDPGNEPVPRVELHS